MMYYEVIHSRQSISHHPSAVWTKHLLGQRLPAATAASMPESAASTIGLSHRLVASVEQTKLDHIQLI